MALTEADTCRKLVVPKLQAAGWDSEPHSIAEQRTITDGRIVPVGQGFIRRPPRRVDYLLRFERNFPLAVVEAKAAWKRAGEGLQQAKEYAEMLGLKFAYATNGREIVEFDYCSGRETISSAYPTPVELWARYRAANHLSDDAAARLLTPMNHAVGKGERYYQEIAVNRAVEGILAGRRHQLLTMATGTGKTAVAFQICWKLWNARWNRTGEHLRPRILYLADRRALQERSIFGAEPKTLPYLLCQMNLLLHGLDAPQIDPGNSLRHKLTEIGEKDRVDVILTNPPFGGEEEKGIQGNFPEDKQTAETALLFLQLIMRKLKRRPTAADRPARAAVVVPNGTLFGDGICARIKEELLKDFNLHTIVRLPNGVFAPYTSIPTNLLFFDRSGSTQNVWYYEHPLPKGRKNYTKTQPLQFEEFAPCLAWWPKRQENDRAWKVPTAELLSNNCNLDRKNPNAREDITHLPPEQLAASILEKEKRIIEILEKIQGLLGGRAS